MKKIFTFLTLTVLIGAAAPAQDNRHGQYREQSPTYQQDNGRGYSDPSQTHGGYQSNESVYNQSRDNESG